MTIDPHQGKKRTDDVPRSPSAQLSGKDATYGMPAQKYIGLTPLNILF
jgi:hypothetical protein